MTGTGSCDVKPVDVSKFLYPGDIKLYPGWEIAIKITVGVILDALALIGNFIVILIVVKGKKMRTTTNFYILNLAISDMVVALCSVWIHVVADLNEDWILGGFLCKFSPFVQITPMCANVFTLIAIAGDRFFAIMYPLKSRVTNRRLVIVLPTIWALAIAIGCPLLFVYTYNERQWKDHFERFCTEIWPMTYSEETGCDYGKTSKRAFWIIICIVLNWVPMVVMTVVYAIILHRLRFNRIGPQNGTMSLSSIQQKSKQKVVKMLFSVLLVFMICTIPFQVTNIFELYRLKQSERLPPWFDPFYFSALMLMYANSAINPIIYGGLNESFRKGFRELITTAIGKYRQDSHGALEMNRRSVQHGENRIRRGSTLDGQKTTESYVNYALTDNPEK